MIPVIAIVGRPNVGKSTLFNRITKSREAIVADRPGVTRDRKYGHAQVNERQFILIDTGGLGEEEDGIDLSMASQSRQAIDEADIIVFLVDGKSGITAGDENLAEYLRQLSKPIYLIVNKTDGIDPDQAMTDFYQLGFNKVHPIAASQGHGVTILLEKLVEDFPEVINATDATLPEQDPGIKIAVVGKPNVGKSTLVNRILGEERVIVFDQPGTTRDSIYIPFERKGKRYTLIDTAGVRRRGKVSSALEKFSIIKTLQAIDDANVIIMVIDARDQLTDQDLKLLGFIIESGRSLVVSVNKWDGMDQGDKQKVKHAVKRRLDFVDFAKMHYISALHGTGVGDLFGSIQQAYRSAMQEMSSAQLTAILEHALEEHQPPLVRGRRIKLRFAHPGGHNPPLVVIHGNQTDSIPDSYKRYLNNTFRKALKLVGTPIRILYKKSENPYAGKRNKLTPTQQRKRKRMLKRKK